MDEELSFAVWGAFLAAIVLLVVYFDDDRLHRPGYVLAGIGVFGLLYTSNWLGEELCDRSECRPAAKTNFNLWLASISLVGAGLLWFELTASIEAKPPLRDRPAALMSTVGRFC